MYGTASVWNVVISFSVGVYLGVNDRTTWFAIGGVPRPLFGSMVLLTIAVLSTVKVMPYALRGVLFAFYPLVFVPLLFAVSNKLPHKILGMFSFFASLSYEFYILHFYFINGSFADFFPIHTSLRVQVMMSFLATLVVAYAISRVASYCRKMADGYLLAG
jgi:hypothetical protein